MSRVLKGAMPPPGQRIDASVHAATERARELLAAAEAAAQAVRAAAERDREAVRAAAVEAGRQEGLAAAAATVLRAAADRERRLAALSGEIAALAIDVARKVLGRELATDRSAVIDLACRAVAEARGRREIAVRASPGDVPVLRAAEVRLGPGLAIVEDPGLGAGEVVIETEAGRIDGRFEAQLAALARALEEAGP